MKNTIFDTNRLKDRPPTASDPGLPDISNLCFVQYKKIIFLAEFLRQAKLGKEKTESKFINVSIWQPHYGSLLRPA
jgi:hypothetical protein